MASTVLSALSIHENVDLKPYNSFGVSALARFYVTVDSASRLAEALQWRRDRDLPLLVLGGGSNVLLRGNFPGLVLHMRAGGLRVAEEGGDQVILRAAGGENWHGLVMATLERGWYGLENLALIPGTVGAAPIQNIGAYGVELQECFAGLEAVEIISGESRRFSLEECRFAYRDSVFKHELKGRYVITAVDLRLSRVPSVNISYEALRQELAARLAEPEQASPRQVAEAVCRVRRSKLPEPALQGNAGSFFKNPVIARIQYQQLKEQWPEMPCHEVPGDKDLVKLPAAWLLDRAGWKGRREGAVGVHEQQPLVLVNHGGASGLEVASLARRMQEDIESRFGILLEPEVQLV